MYRSLAMRQGVFGARLCRCGYRLDQANLLTSAAYSLSETV